MSGSWPVYFLFELRLSLPSSPGVQHFSSHFCCMQSIIKSQRQTVVMRDQSRVIDSPFLLNSNYGYEVERAAISIP